MSTYVTLEEAKAHIRVDFDDDDAYIDDLIEVCEQAIINEVTGSYPGTGTVATAGTTTLTGSDTTFTNLKAGDIIKVYGESLRTVGSVTSDTVLTVTAAFSTTKSSLTYVVTPTPLVSGVLPKPLKQAILIIIGHLYNQREPVIIGSSAVKVPMTVDYLIAPYKLWTCK